MDVEKLNLGYSLMVASYFSHKPYLQTFDFEPGTTTSVKSHYQAIGCGAPLANYLLSELAVKGMDTKHGKAVAVFVVEKTIQHVAFCDRPTKLSIIFP